MDKGPFQMPQRPTDRGTSSRSTASQPVEEPKPVHRPVAAPHHASKEKQSKKPLIVTIVTIAIVALVVIGGWMAWSNMNSGTGIDGGKYQAVFFTNGQVYFGKLHAFNSEYMKLTDVYYLQAQNTEQDPKNPQKTAEEANNVQLIKLGNEIHGPQDEMIIAKDQVLFYENLKSDGKVSASIEKSKNPN